MLWIEYDEDCGWIVCHVSPYGTVWETPCDSREEAELTLQRMTEEFAQG